MEPSKYFTICLARHAAVPQADSPDKDASPHLVGRAAEDLMGWLIQEQGWSWVAARVLAAKFVDRAILWVLVEEGLASLESDLEIIWEGEREAAAARGRTWMPVCGSLLDDPPTEGALPLPAP